MSPMFYREIAPNSDASHIIFSFWEFRVNLPTPEPIVHEIFPDGCRSIFYYKNARFKTSALLVSSLGLESVNVPVFDGDVYWGMRVSPAACRALLNDEMTSEQSRPAAEIPNLADVVRDLTAKLGDCENFEAAISEFETSVHQLKLEAIDERVVSAVRFVEENHAQVKIDEIAAAAGLSRRQFERRFLQSSGLTPKQYLRARRLRATAIKIVENAGQNWANRAAEMGFADQAHLSHEFNALTSRTPGAFAERVKQIEHGKLIK